MVNISVPQSAEDFYSRGNLNVAEGDWEPAIRDFTKAIELEPDFVKAYLQRGLACNVINNPEHAVLDCSKAIELDSMEAAAYLYRGVAYQKLGNLEMAIANVEKYLQFDLYEYHRNLAPNAPNREAIIHSFRECAEKMVAQLKGEMGDL